MLKCKANYLPLPHNQIPHCKNCYCKLLFEDSTVKTEWLNTIHVINPCELDAKQRQINININIFENKMQFVTKLTCIMKVTEFHTWKPGSCHARTYSLKICVKKNIKYQKTAFQIWYNSPDLKQSLHLTQSGNNKTISQYLFHLLLSTQLTKYDSISHTTLHKNIGSGDRTVLNWKDWQIYFLLLS